MVIVVLHAPYYANVATFKWFWRVFRVTWPTPVNHASNILLFGASPNTCITYTCSNATTFVKNSTETEL
jgi:hypothetical protein